MHIISNERALAHWKALSQQPLKFVQRFHKRFLDEQPHLAQFLADCAVARRHPDRKPLQPFRVNATLEEEVAETTDYASLIAEVMRREAGRPLRPVLPSEVEDHMEAVMEAMKNLPRPKATGGAPDFLPLVDLCRQGPLLRGASIAYFSSRKFAMDEVVLVSPLFRMTVDALDAVAAEKPSPTEAAAFWSMDRVEEALSVQGDPMRRPALEAAQINRIELTPRLLAELESWIASPAAALEDDGSLGMHALFLLASWREPSAWPVFRRLFSLPGNMAHDLTGDTVTEHGSVLLASVVGGRQAELREMFEDEAVDEFCRCAALEALACLVAWGELPREEVVGYLRKLLTGRLRSSPENYAWAGVVNVACDMEAWELRPEMEAAFARGLVDEMAMDASYLADAQAGEFGPLWAEFTQRNQPFCDVAEATAWCDKPFEDESEKARLEPPPYLQPGIAPPKAGRNDPCPCGSGKKFKKCCGQ